MEHSIIQDIGIAICVATVMGFVAHLLRQSTILGYFVAGIIIGPAIGPKLVTNPDSIEIISEIGLILLLFIIGLEMDLPKIIKSGKSLITAGIGQFITGVLLGTFFFLALGYSLSGGKLDALYLAIFCALSSTAIVVKLMYDYAQLDTLPGRITLGVLVFQDVWAILVLALQPKFNDLRLMLALQAIGKTAVLFAFSWIISRFFLSWVFKKINKAPELVVAISIAWCAFLAGVAGALDLSMEMGALIAGVAVSSFPYAVHVTANVLSIRDFFLTLFFVSLGMKIPMPELAMIAAVLIIVVFVIVSRFATVYPLLLISGSGHRTAFVSSLNLAQISEFSLVIAALGVAQGHIDEKILSTIIYAMATTSVLSTYFIKNNHRLYLAASDLLKRMGFQRGGETQQDLGLQSEHSAVVLGYHRAAAAMVHELEVRRPELLKELLIIDFNTEIVANLKSKGIAAIFGDISSLDTLRHAHVENARIVFSSTVSDMLLKGTTNLDLVRRCRAIAPAAIIVATAESTRMVEKLSAAGADHVILPYTLSGTALGDILIRTFKKE